MSTGIEVLVGARWLQARLNASPTLAGRVYKAPAPRTAAYPFITHQYAGGNTTRVVPGTIVKANLVFRVFAVGQGNSAEALSLDVAAIVGALHGQRGAAAGGEVLSCVAVLPLLFEETLNGVVYTWAGWSFRLEVTTA